MTHLIFDLSGRVGLATGAAPGRGLATAIGFAEAGANVLITDINADGVQATTENIKTLGQRVLAMTGDVTDVDFIRSLYAWLDHDFGRIDVVANIAGPGQLAKPDSISLQLMERIVYGLVIARLCCCQEAGRRMLAMGKGELQN
jgi:NAD(P)-dependent dehydrogenase (short-subunit alcohol dehydrogenase family)